MLKDAAERQAVLRVFQGQAVAHVAVTVGRAIRCDNARVLCRCVVSVPEKRTGARCHEYRGAQSAMRIGQCLQLQAKGKGPDQTRWATTHPSDTGQVGIRTGRIQLPIAGGQLIIRRGRNQHTAINDWQAPTLVVGLHSSNGMLSEKSSHRNYKRGRVCTCACHQCRQYGKSHLCRGHHRGYLRWRNHSNRERGDGCRQGSGGR